jgi:V/A-type H+/Na+-transporting ATPase subunit A
VIPDPDSGQVRRIAGPVVTATGLERARLYDLVHVGEAMLPGEVIRLEPGAVVVQVYDDPAGLRAGEPVVGSGRPLEVELGPGLLGGIFDGVQRPLPALAAVGDEALARPFVERGLSFPALGRDREWAFEPSVSVGEQVVPGDVLGTVAEGPLSHRILAPEGVAGTVTDVRTVTVGVEEPVAWIDRSPVSMLRRSPVRQPLPVARRLDPHTPLITGQRVIDTLFAVPRGGAATVPGGFGTGKTQLEQALAKWSDADVVVYVACGERGNELSEVLDELPALTDPRTGSSLMERTIIVANTSNMPVAAREASIYTGTTMAEYFRDQGYDVVLLADSISRWGEALREVSSRLEEMPAEEGYPAYLASRLAEFYERAGAVVCRGTAGRVGSVTIVAAVSPPGGDFSEPITQHSLRLAGTFWALDATLAHSRHFPAIEARRSYTLYDLGSWFDAEIGPDWHEQRAWALDLLEHEGALREIVQIVGADTLGAPEQVALRTGRLLREDFQQQSAFDDLDAYCPPEKQYWMLRAIRRAHEAMDAAVARGADVGEATTIEALAEISRLKHRPPDEARRACESLTVRIAEALEAL